MTEKAALFYFVKYPEPGKVKTRLARTIGDEAAAAVYRKLAERNFSILKECRMFCELIVFYDPADREKEMPDWLQGADHYWAQGGGDLTARLTNAFKQGFDRGFGNVFALGSDTLDLESAILREALERLRSSDVVIGPARDGGYYLIGMSRPHLSLFQGVEWSTGSVLSSTLSRAEEARLTCALLPELEDLDDETSLEHFLDESKKTR